MFDLFYPTTLLSRIMKWFVVPDFPLFFNRALKSFTHMGNFFTKRTHNLTSLFPTSQKTWNQLACDLYKISVDF